MANKNRAWFIVEDGRVPQSFWVTRDENKNGLWDIFFKQGNKLNLNEVGIIKFYVRNNKWGNIDYVRSWDFLHNSADIPLANEKALKLLEEIASGEFQAIPTEVIMPDGHVIKEYKLINVIKKVPGLLLEHSIVDPKAKIDGYGLTHYKILHHRLDALRELNLAREQKLAVAVLYGSNKLKEAIKAEKLTGLVFKDSYAGYEFWHEK